MERRHLLKLLLSGVVGHTLDLDRLLWIPNQKKIFIPSSRIKGITLSQIVALEHERIMPRIRELFDRDDLFYHLIDRGHSPHSAIREIIEMRIPLVIQPKNIDWGK